MEEARSTNKSHYPQRSSPGANPGRRELWGLIMTWKPSGKRSGGVSQDASSDGSEVDPSAVANTADLDKEDDEAAAEALAKANELKGEKD